MIARAAINNILIIISGCPFDIKTAMVNVMAAD
jgi:hypothetical protein